MARRTNDPHDDSYLDDEADQSLWSSPVKELPHRNAPSHSGAQHTHTQSSDTTTSKATHEENLRRELASVRKVNEVIEGVLESLAKARSNMKSVKQTVGAASSLLDIWTRILSQTEHNQRLILDPNWHGASQDITDMEEEAVAKQQAAERKEVEEQERKAAAAQKAEEDERKRAAAAAASTVGRPKSALRGSSRTGLGRGSSASSARGGSYSAASANTSSSGSSLTRGSGTGRRPASGIGRGVRGSRSRA